MQHFVSCYAICRGFYARFRERLSNKSRPFMQAFRNMLTLSCNISRAVMQCFAGCPCNTLRPIKQYSVGFYATFLYDMFRDLFMRCFAGLYAIFRAIFCGLSCKTSTQLFRGLMKELFYRLLCNISLDFAQHFASCDAKFLRDFVQHLRSFR